MFIKYEGLTHTGESNFKKGARSIRILSVHNRIVRVLNTAPHPLSLCCAKDAPVLLKFHNGIRYVGFPTDNEIPDRHVCTIDRQPRQKRQGPGAPFVGSGLKAAGHQILVCRFSLGFTAVRAYKYLVGIHPKVTPMNNDRMKPELRESVGCLVSPYYVVKFADFEKPCRRRSGGLFPRVLSVATRMACPFRVPEPCRLYPRCG